MVLEAISLGCGVWASLITFLLFISPLKVSIFFYFQGEANGTALEIVAWVCLS